MMKSFCIHTVLLFVAVLTKGECSWWFLSQVKMSAVGSGPSPAFCDLVPGLSRRQRMLCQSNLDVMTAIGTGVEQGVKECQQQFSNQRWNCTTVDKSGFGKVVLKLGSREAAFVYAISSAGVVHSVARACATGQISSCSCDYTNRGVARDVDGRMFTWGGCADNVRYATTFARRFIDAKEKVSRDGRSLMNLHNNRAGRKAVRRNMRLQCKCHGVSGSCTTRTCWKSVGNFKAIGNHLSKKYKKARQVTINPEGQSLMPSSTGQLRFDSPISMKVTQKPHSSKFNLKQYKEKIQKADLVFFDPSPDYCEIDPKTGSPGTSGRECNRTSGEVNSCDVLCCGRGYDTKRVVKMEKCQCKFVWCCKVECKLCRNEYDVHTCKGGGASSTATTNEQVSPHSLLSNDTLLALKRRYHYRFGSRNTQ